jgi:hypothetical protein
LKNRIAIHIPLDLYEKIKDKITGTSFRSVEEYIVRMLENDFPVEQEYNEEEAKIIRERLRRLGYIE